MLLPLAPAVVALLGQEAGDLQRTGAVCTTTPRLTPSAPSSIAHGGLGRGFRCLDDILEVVLGHGVQPSRDGEHRRAPPEVLCELHSDHRHQR